jgi:folate-binding protein YgfZ
LTSKFFAEPLPPRGILKLTGEDRSAFLQGLVSNDLRKLAPNHGLWAALLTPQGKYLHDFFLTETDGAILLDVEGERLADLKKRLGMFKLRAKIVIEDVTEAFEAWQGWGDGAAAAFGLAASGDAAAVEGGTVLLDPRIATLGLRAVLPRGIGAAPFEAKGFVLGDWADWDRLRLDAGVPDGRRDMELEKAILLENGFDELGGVAWDKGCYMGQELTARTKYRGLVKKRLMPVRLDGALPAPGTIVTRPDGGEAGEIRSGRDGRALALIRLDALGLDGDLLAGATRVRPVRPGWARF